MKHRNLIVLRAGGRFLHWNWMPVGSQHRTWDLAINYCGKGHNPYTGAYDSLHRQIGSK